MCRRVVFSPHSAFAVISAVGDACGSRLVTFWFLTDQSTCRFTNRSKKNAFLHRLVQLKVHFVLFRAGVSELGPDPTIRR